MVSCPVQGRPTIRIPGLRQQSKYRIMIVRYCPLYGRSIATIFYVHVRAGIEEYFDYLAVSIDDRPEQGGAGVL